jgi:hypothetical protein
MLGGNYLGTPIGQQMHRLLMQLVLHGHKHSVFLGGGLVSTAVLLVIKLIYATARLVCVAFAGFGICVCDNTCIIP